MLIDTCMDALGMCSCQVLILSPTRELAQQTEKVILAIGEFINIQAHACVGGKSLGEDIRKLESGVHAVSGTPGRVFDMIKRKALNTRQIKTLILDEADEMLAKNFKDQIYDIYRQAVAGLQHAWLHGRARALLGLLVLGVLIQRKDVYYVLCSHAEYASHA